MRRLLILGSLSSVVLQAFQSYLAGNLGLPLAMIANAFELNSAQFLLRKAFWTSLWFPEPITGKRFSFAGFWLLSLSAVLFALLCGPSSAIAIIPTLNYFDISSPFNQTMPPFYILNRSTELWPPVLTASSFNIANDTNNCVVETSTSNQGICPSNGVRDILNWAGNLVYQDIDTGTNISFQDYSSDTRRVLTVQSCNTTLGGRASGISLNQFITGALAGYWDFAQNNFGGEALKAAQPHIKLENEIFAPQVDVICNTDQNLNVDDLNNPATYIQTNMSFPTATTAASSPIPVPDWAYKYTHSPDLTNFTFLEIPQAGQQSSLLGAVRILIWSLLALDSSCIFPIAHNRANIGTLYRWQYFPFSCRTVTVHGSKGQRIMLVPYILDGFLLMFGTTQLLVIKYLIKWRLIWETLVWKLPLTPPPSGKASIQL
jgi:hypothetical protein